MASGAASMDVEEEVICLICLEFLEDPVTLDCGHNFCRSCITGHRDTWEQVKGGHATCPDCKVKIPEGNLWTNWQLASLVEKIKHLSLSSAKQDLCMRHKKKLQLFCEEDKQLLCWLCERSPEHRGHSVLILTEAAQQYKVQLCSSLKILRKKREEILVCKANIEKECEALLKLTLTERQRAVAEFRQLREFLEAQEKNVLAQMTETEQDIRRRMDENMTNLSKELSSLEKMIQEMEAKCQQSANDLLQDVGNTLQRYEEKEAFEAPVAFPPALKWKIWDICDLNPFLDSIMKPFKDTLISGLQLQKANVVLDPDTANPNLILSGDRKSVRWGDKPQRLPDNPERFDVHPFVLGREGFTAGRHFWEVTVGSEEGWILGVARKSVRRKGQVRNNPNEGIWPMMKWEHMYKISSSSTLSLGREPKRVRMFLNCSAGRLAFFDADTADLILAYTGASFSGETLLPFFCVTIKAHLIISP